MAVKSGRYTSSIADGGEQGRYSQQKKLGGSVFLSAAVSFPCPQRIAIHPSGSRVEGTGAASEGRHADGGGGMNCPPNEIRATRVCSDRSSGGTPIRLSIDPRSSVLPAAVASSECTFRVTSGTSMMRLPSTGRASEAVIASVKPDRSGFIHAPAGRVVPSNAGIGIAPGRRRRRQALL